MCIRDRHVAYQTSGNIAVSDQDALKFIEVSIDIIGEKEKKIIKEVELLENHYEVLIVDNLSNSSISVLENIKSIISGNVYFEKIDESVEQCLDHLRNKAKQQ